MLFSTNEKYFIKGKNKLKNICFTLFSISIFLLSSDVHAVGWSDVIDSTWTDTLQSGFKFVVIIFAFAGFCITAAALFGLVMLHLKPDSPAAQKAQQAGKPNLFIAMFLGAIICVLGSIYGLFIGTATGTNDNDALRQLESGSINIGTNSYATNDLDVIPAVKKDA